MTFRSRNPFHGRTFALLVGSSCLLWSQGSPVGNICGTVLAPDGKPMAGLPVAARTPRGDHRVRTDEKGRFLLPQLPPGPVRILVHASDFEEINVRALVVVNQTTNLDLRMRKTVGATVEVIDAATIVSIDANQAKAGKYQSMETIEDLPLVDDNRVDSVVSRTPGVVPNSHTFNGVDYTYNAVNIDGVDVRSGSSGQQAVSLNNHFIDQVQVLTNGISAKYGTFAGGVINVTTKSGTNEIKGTADYDITNPKWKARDKLSRVQTEMWRTVPTVVSNHHTTIQSYTFTGPLIKDRLFFAWSLRNQTPTTVTHRVTSAPYFSGTPYESTSRNYRQDAKLDWQVNRNNNIYVDWNESTSKSSNQGSNTSAYTTAATLPGVSKTTTGYLSGGWTSILANNLFMDLKLSESTNASGGPGTGPTGGSSVVTWQSVRSADRYLYLDNGSGNTIKQEMKTQSQALNFTCLVDALGQHTFEFGIQNTKFIQKGGYSSTPSNYRIKFNGFNVPSPPDSGLAYRSLTAGSAGKTILIWEDPIRGEATSSALGLYLNDSWALNKSWSFNLGLRYDRFHYFSSPEKNKVDYGRIDPRLSINYDIQGNKKHILSLSGSIYSALPLIGDFSAASVTSSPVTRTYVYVGTGGGNQGNGLDALTSSGTINWAAWGNMSGATGKDNAYSVSDPLTNRNVFVDQDIQAPHSRELHFSYTYQSDIHKFSASLVRRWTTDQFTQVAEGNATTGIARFLITNDPSSRQDYYALILTEDAKVTPKLTMGANLTWSRNLSNAGATVSPGPAYYGGNIPRSMLNPYGSSPMYDMPIVIGSDARYRTNVGSGFLNLGVIGTYTGLVSMGYRYAGAATNPDLVAMGYSGYFTRQFPELGTVWDPSFFNVDLQIGYEQPVWRKANAYVKLNISNIFNYRKRRSDYHSSTLVDSNGDNYPANGAAADIAYAGDPIYEGSAQLYRTGRSLHVVTGIRF